MATMSPYEYNIVPLLQPIDAVANDQTTGYIDLRYCQELSFLVQIGVITTGTATDNIQITVDAATGVDGTEAAIGFSYREGGLVTANTWGALTTVGATGIDVASTDDGKSYWIFVDPAALAANDYRVARLVIGTPADMAAALESAVAFIKPRYSQTTHISVTASASA